MNSRPPVPMQPPELPDMPDALADRASAKVTSAIVRSCPSDLNKSH